MALTVALSGCGGGPTADSTENSPATTAPTTTTDPGRQAGPATPPPKENGTTTTTEPVGEPVTPPDGFPEGIPLPPGQVGYYTGSPEVGFHLNISTAMTFSDLVSFFTDGLAEQRNWSIGVRDIGQGYLPGYEGVWAQFTAPDHVVTQLTGGYQGVIEIEGRHVDILLDGLIQPLPGEEPAALPPPTELPRPEDLPIAARYSSGIVKVEYADAPELFSDLLSQYRSRQWVELAVSDSNRSNLIAVGDLGNWRITMTADGATLEMEFENRALSFP